MPAEVVEPLAALGCTIDGDVPTWDAGSATWICGSAAAGGGCSLAVISDGVAELTCGGTSVRLTRAGEYISAAAGVRVRVDGTLRGAGAPSGVFASVWGYWYGTRCALDAAGAATCWDNAGSVAAPGGAYTMVGCDYDSCCAAAQSGAPVCFGTNAVALSNPPNVTFVDIAISNQVACGVTNVGTVDCWGGASALDYAAAAPSGTSFTAIGSQSGNFYAGGSSSIGQFSGSPGVNIPVPSPVVDVQGPVVLLQSGEVYRVNTGGVGTLEPWGEQLFSSLGTVNTNYGVAADGRYLPITVPAGTTPE